MACSVSASGSFEALPEANPVLYPPLRFALLVISFQDSTRNSKLRGGIKRMAELPDNLTYPEPPMGSKSKMGKSYSEYRYIYY